MRKGRAAIIAVAVMLSLTLFLLYQPRIIVIASSSMRPSLEPGDAVLIVKVKPEEIRVGDVISYVKVVPFASMQIVTHRVVEANDHGDFYSFKTKGDANPNPDSWDVTPKEIMGKAVIVIPKLGYILYHIRANLVTIALTTLGLGFILIYKEQSDKEYTSNQVANNCQRQGYNAV